MTILEELRRDHEYLQTNLEELEGSTGEDTRLLALASEIEEHNRLEERLLIRDLEPELKLEGGLVETLYREHERIAQLIAAIRASSEAPRDLALYRHRLVELLRQHFTEEEQVFFPFAERLLDADWRAGRGAAFRQARSPHPLRVGPDVRVADLARESPATIRVFQRHGIDFCCGGKRGLREACATRGADYASVAGELAQVLSSGDSGEQESWIGRPAVEIVGHVLARYHAGLREELARLEAMAARAAERHGAAHPELVEIHALVTELRGQMVAHLDHEERVLFPAVLRGDGSEIEKEFGAAEEEHAMVGRLLARLREATSEFVPPPEACNTWRGLFHGLSDLEKDTHVHIHLENNLLFPQALAQPLPVGS